MERGREEEEGMVVEGGVAFCVPGGERSQMYWRRRRRRGIDGEREEEEDETEFMFGGQIK